MPAHRNGNYADIDSDLDDRSFGIWVSWRIAGLWCGARCVCVEGSTVRPSELLPGVRVSNRHIARLHRVRLQVQRSHRHGAAIPCKRGSRNKPMKRSAFQIIVFPVLGAIVSVVLMSCDDETERLSAQFAATTGLLSRTEILDRVKSGAFVSISADELTQLCGDPERGGHFRLVSA